MQKDDNNNNIVLNLDLILVLSRRNGNRNDVGVRVNGAPSPAHERHSMVVVVNDVNLNVDVLMGIL
jgi:hypothetical protein